MVGALRSAGSRGVSGVEFDSHSFPGGRIMRYSARILDLRQRGYEIDSVADATGTSRYILRAEPAPLEARPRILGGTVVTERASRAPARTVEDVPSEGLFALDNYKRKPMRPE